MRFIKLFCLIILCLIISSNFGANEVIGNFKGLNGSHNVEITFFRNGEIEPILVKRSNNIPFHEGEFSVSLDAIEDEIIEDDVSIEIKVDGVVMIERTPYIEDLHFMVSTPMAISSDEEPGDGGVILEEMAPSLEIGNGVDDAIVVDGSDFGIGLAAGSDAASRLEVQGGAATIWDGAATVGYAAGEGDLFVENELEVDGTIYSSSYRSNDGTELINEGTGISVTEETDGSWTVELGGSSGTGLTYNFTNCGQTGRTGPTQTQANTTYSGTTLDGDVTVTGGIQAWTVPATGTYTITAAGAAGGRQTYSSGYNGGRGAIISGTFNLTGGETIYIICGQKGEDTRSSVDNAAPGGGGGSFVYRNPTDTYPLIAAGGGGSGARCNSFSGYQDANYTTAGNRSGSLANGGSSGNGGTSNAGGSSYWAGGGSGWLTDGTGGNVTTNYSYNGSYADGGRAPRNGALGGSRHNDGTDEGGDGGFGGGGGGGSDNMGGGGGGGYSGGGGARYDACGNEPGGGGGSYNAGTSPSNDGYNTGHGYVTIVSSSGSGGGLTLNDLTDVNTTSSSRGDILYNNGTAWQTLALGDSGYVLTSDGDLPVWNNNGGVINENWTFTSSLDGWTSTAACGYSYNWAWNSDGGVGTAYFNPPSGNSSAYVSSPSVSVTGATTVNLEYRTRYSTESCCDHGYVAYRIDGGSWTLFTPSTGSYSGTDGQYYDALLGGCSTSTHLLYFGSSGYVTHSGDITIGGGSTLQIAFHFSSDGSVESGGMWVDYVTLSGSGGSGGGADNDWSGAGSGTMTATSTTDNVGIGTSSVTGRLDVRGDEVRIWDGSASCVYALGSGDLFVEDVLEVDNSIYSPRMYDQDNTAYFNDPAGTSVNYISDNRSYTYNNSSNYGGDVAINDDLVPSSSGSYDLGTSSYRWSDLWINDRIYLNGSYGSAGQVLTSNGSGDAYWSTASGGSQWTDYGSYLRTSEGESVYPYTSNSYDLGSTSYYWRYVYASRYYDANSTTYYLDPASTSVLYTLDNRYYIYNGGSSYAGYVAFNDNIVPTSSSYDIGYTTYRWDDIFLGSSSVININGDDGDPGEVLKINASGNIYWGEDESGGSGTVTCVNPWGENVYGSLSGPISWSYTMGYDFTPSVDGQITELGGRFSGTKTVYLWNDNTGSLLASASVAGTGSSFAYSSISPVNVTAGTRYCVAVYLAGNGGYYRSSVSMPDTYGNITIHNSCYYSGSGRPTNSITTTMYGMADVTFCTSGGTVTPVVGCASPACGVTDRGEITPSTAYQYATYASGTNNYYHFEATAGRYYSFSLCSNSEDSYVRIYNSSCTMVASNDDNGDYCSGVPASIKWYCSTSGTYTVSPTSYSCDNWSSSGSCQYWWSSTFARERERDEDEPDWSLCEFDPITGRPKEIHAHGTGILEDGFARIDYEYKIQNLAGDSPPSVVITPIGEKKDLYIGEFDRNGFTVIDDEGGSDVQFNWIAIVKPKTPGWLDEYIDDRVELKETYYSYPAEYSYERWQELFMQYTKSPFPFTREEYNKACRDYENK